MLSCSQGLSLLRLSLLLVLVVCASRVHGETQTTCKFKIVFPPTQYPSLSEVLEGTISYDDRAESATSLAFPTYPPGHNVTGITGTRMVQVASSETGKQSQYGPPSTVTITGVIPITSPLVYLGVTSNSPGTGDGSPPPAAYGAYVWIPGAVLPCSSQLPQCTVPVANNLVSTCGTASLCPAAAAFLFWDNYIYPTGVTNHLDPSGLLLTLSGPQPGAIFIAGLGYVYTIYNGALDTTSTLWDDSDWASYQGPGYDTGGFDGTMTLSDCSSSPLHPLPPQGGRTWFPKPPRGVRC